MAYTKQSVGIDISKDSFTACLCKRSDLGEFEFSKTTTFSNDKTGFNQFLRWVNSQIIKTVELVFLMEATGVYYESLAHHLFKLKKRVHVALPNTTKHYFSSLNVKSKTDAIDAKWLSQFGAERNHKPWIPPSPIVIQLRNLTRYHVQLQEQRTALGNIKHSKDCSHEIQQFILKSNKGLIAQIDKQIAQCKLEIEELITSDEYLNNKVQNLLTIKGVGLMTIATILAETMCFEHFTSIKQLASFSGYDVVQRESGTSVKGQTRISKKGNRYIRNAMYFPSMVACRFNPIMKETYTRINQKKSSKMIGQVAIQRKLLALIYTLWKKDTVFDPNYKKVAPAITEATQDSLTSKLL